MTDLAPRAPARPVRKTLSEVYDHRLVDWEVYYKLLPDTHRDRRRLQRAMDAALYGEPFEACDLPREHRDEHGID